MPPAWPVRNLLRGYGLRMPTGQAVAKHLGLPALTAGRDQGGRREHRAGQVLRNTGSSPAPPCGTTFWPRPNTTAAPPRPGRQHHRRRGPDRPSPTQRRLHPAHRWLDPVPARRHPRPLRARRPPPLRQSPPGHHTLSGLAGSPYRRRSTIPDSPWVTHVAGSRPWSENSAGLLP